MTSNIEKLGQTLQGRMHTVKKAGSSILIELGTISSGLQLHPDISPGPIPKGEYSICRSVSDLVLKKGKVVTGSVYMEDIHYQKLKDGDRVLMAWCGNEPVVIDRLATGGGDSNG